MEGDIFELFCVVCQTETEVSVVDSDEEPIYCPMCGSEIEIG
jgi:DNA-directed RNA polymerase subunit RPC12/RpoP